ncbi:uncharacterized protein [Prorops nasuta]|uniref:uncharacterized protein n=1 Tax=Prorops nasuta TaxID=863751 RepID=UPI0034CE8DAB
MVFEKPCQLPKLRVIPRHCLSKQEHIDMLAAPKFRCPPTCSAKAVKRKLKPISARINDLAAPTKRRLLMTLQEDSAKLPPELVDNLIKTMENETCLTPEQAAKIVRSKKRKKEKQSSQETEISPAIKGVSMRKSHGHMGQMKKSRSTRMRRRIGPMNLTSGFDRDAVNCQYSMAERFVQSILEWKCPIPREEFQDISEVILRRLTYLLEYVPMGEEDRKSQQMRFLADLVACWISGVLFEVADSHKREIQEECDKKKREMEEAGDDDDDDDDKRRGRDDDLDSSGDEYEDGDDEDEDGGGGPGGTGRGKKDKAGGDDVGGDGGNTGDRKQEKKKDKGKMGKKPDATEETDEVEGERKKKEVKDQKQAAGGKREADVKEKKVDKVKIEPEPEAVPPAKDEKRQDGEEKPKKIKEEEKPPSDNVAIKLEEPLPGLGIEEAIKLEESVKLEEALPDPEIEEISEVPVLIADDSTLSAGEPVSIPVDDGTVKISVGPPSPIVYKKEETIGESKTSQLSEEPAILVIPKITSSIDDTSESLADDLQEFDLGDDKEEMEYEAFDTKEIIGDVKLQSTESLISAKPHVIRTEDDESGLLKMHSISAPQAKGDDLYLSEKNVTEKYMEVPKKGQFYNNLVPCPDRTGLCSAEARKKKRQYMRGAEGLDHLMEIKSQCVPTKAEKEIHISTRCRIPCCKPQNLEDSPLTGCWPQTRFDIPQQKELSNRCQPTMLQEDEREKLELFREWISDTSEKLRGKPLVSSPDKIGDFSKLFKTDLPFVTFGKIFHVIYSMVESAPENKGDDAVINRIHRAVLAKLLTLVECEDSNMLTDTFKDVMDVVCGKIAAWLKSILNESQISFLEKNPAEVESREVRDWSKWLTYVSESANDWSSWLKRTLEEAKNMQNEITREKYQTWAKAVDNDALSWRRFHLETLHRAHQNITMMSGRDVISETHSSPVKTRKISI